MPGNNDFTLEVLVADTPVPEYNKNGEHFVECSLMTPVSYRVQGTDVVNGEKEVQVLLHLCILYLVQDCHNTSLLAFMSISIIEKLLTYYNKMKNYYVSKVVLYKVLSAICCTGNCISKEHTT